MEALQILYHALQVNKDAGYSEAAALTFLLCDVSSNLEDEIKFIWRGRWGLVKPLYVLSRYYAIINIIVRLIGDSRSHSLEFCRSYIWWMSIGGTFMSDVILNVVLVLRIYALYGRSKKVLAIFSVLCIASIGLMLYSIAWIGRGFNKNVVQPPVRGWTGCIAMLGVSLVKVSLMAWLSSILVSIVFFVATLVKFKESIDKISVSGISRLSLVTDMRYFSPILAVFVRDGAFFFMIVTTTLIVGAIISVYKESFYAMPFQPWYYSMCSFAGSHMLLNLRRLGGSGTPTVITTRPLGSMHFAGDETSLGVEIPAPAAESDVDIAISPEEHIDTPVTAAGMFTENEKGESKV